MALADPIVFRRGFQTVIGRVGRTANKVDGG